MPLSRPPLGHQRERTSRSRVASAPPGARDRGRATSWRRPRGSIAGAARGDAPERTTNSALVADAVLQQVTAPPRPSARSSWRRRARRTARGRARAARPASRGRRAPRGCPRSSRNDGGRRTSTTHTSGRSRSYRLEEGSAAVRPRSAATTSAAVVLQQPAQPVAAGSARSRRSTTPHGSSGAEVWSEPPAGLEMKRVPPRASTRLRRPVSPRVGVRPRGARRRGPSTSSPVPRAARRRRRGRRGLGVLSRRSLSARHRRVGRPSRRPSAPAPRIAGDGGRDARRAPRAR